MNDSFALTHLYHPGTGAKVSIPLDITSILTQDHAQNLIRSVDNLLIAGFTVNLPGLEDGEFFEQIGFAVRREKVNDDQSVTAIVDLYPAQGNFRILGMYLNTPADEVEFEKAIGLSLKSMPLFDGMPIERGKKPTHDKFVVALKSPAKLVYKQNPRWEGENDKKHPKRLFVRWEGLRSSENASSDASALNTEQMSYEKARAVLTPAGIEIGTLDAEKLTLILTANNSKITNEMRKAAQVILDEIKHEGA